MGIYLRKMKTYIRIKTCIHVYSTTTYKQPQNKNNQISISRYMYKQTVGHSLNGILLSIKMNDLLITMRTHMNLKKLLYWVKEARLKNQSTYYMILSIENSGKMQTNLSYDSSMGKMRGVGRGKREEFFSKSAWRLFRWMDVFIVLIVGMVSRGYMYLQTDWLVHSKHVQFIGCQLYFKKARIKKKPCEE